MNINKRLDNLEGAAKPDRGHVVLWADLEGNGYWDQVSSDPGRRRITEAEKVELEKLHDLIVVEYVQKAILPQG